MEGSTVSLDRAHERPPGAALHGLSRALIANMVTGVTEGFKKDLEIQGVGFKAAVKGQKLDSASANRTRSFSTFPTSSRSRSRKTPRSTSKASTSSSSARSPPISAAYYPPEPYKGKGVRYAGEQVRRKEGKTVQ